MHGGFEVLASEWCGPNLCFPKALEQSARFLRQKIWRQVTLPSRQKLGIARLR